MADFDVTIIGAGPGGYVAAIRAGQLGLKTAIVERDEVGGICLNWGCIPSKALLRNAELLNLINEGDKWGFTFDNLRVDFGKAIDRSREVVNRLTRGVRTLLKKNKVEVVKGEGTMANAHTVKVGSQQLSTNNIIIATGARAKSLPALPVDGETVVTSREALEARSLPDHAVIVGGGATGVEFAYLYNAYGARVTIVELLPNLVPNEDEEISQQLERALGKQGINIMTGSKVEEMVLGNGVAKLTVSGKNGLQELQADRVLVAVGVQGNVENLGLEQMEVPVEREFIRIDGHMSTGVPGVYAIGDVTGKLLLAHVASAQGVYVVEKLAGKESPELDYPSMPRATYCVPQVTSFGLTEKQAKEEGVEYRVGKFPFIASGKALALGATEGLVKVVVNSFGEIIGAHLIGPEVTELLAELSLARLLEGTTNEVGWMVHSHPTLSEAIKEAALAADGRAIHV